MEHEKMNLSLWIPANPCKKRKKERGRKEKIKDQSTSWILQFQRNWESNENVLIAGPNKEKGASETAPERWKEKLCNKSFPLYK